MPTLRKPSADAVPAFPAAQAELPFTYPDVGATAAEPPPGWTVDRTRARVGTGPGAFAAAKAALARWEQFRLGWVEAAPAGAPLAPGACVAVLARVLGLWWLNACRVVYTVDEETRFGFAYGTLPGHAESGEERFLVEWDRASGAVWYDIVAFSPGGRRSGSRAPRSRRCGGRSGARTCLHPEGVGQHSPGRSPGFAKA